MKISILAQDLSHNCLGRAWLLADILKKYYKVEIIGPVLGDGIWEPLRDCDIELKSVSVMEFPLFALQIPKILRNIDGDVIYASKPVLTSFDIGLVKKYISGNPLVLDIDDWQLGFVPEGTGKSKSFYQKTRSLLRAVKRTVLNPNQSRWVIKISDRLISLADEVTVSNNYLQQKFGGEIIWHARDAAKFDPRKYDRASLRKQYDMELNEKIVLFSGTPRRHKGVEDLIKALSKVPQATLFVIGMDDREYCQELISKAEKSLGEERFRALGMQPFSKIPEILTLSDAVTVPQRERRASVGQVPAKLFDAMAMAKPIVATKVSDIPEVLGGGGWLVEPESPDELAEAIDFALEHPKKSENKGKKARERFRQKYSYDAMEEKLLELFSKYE